MEALVAFGLAANIVQFVDFGFKLFSQANEIKRSGSVSQHVDLDRVTRSLDLVSHKALENLANGCIDLSHDLQSALNVLRAEPDKGRWRSFAHALRVSWRADKVDRLVNRLTDLRDQLEIHIMVSLRHDFASRSIVQDEQFAAFSEDIQTIIKAILQGHQFFTTTLDEQTALIVKQHHVSEELAAMRHRQTLAAIAQVGRESESLKLSGTRQLDPKALEELRNNLRPALERKVLESLNFSQKLSREEDVAWAHRQTFSWIFSNSQEGQADSNSTNLDSMEDAVQVNEDLDTTQSIAEDRAEDDSLVDEEVHTSSSFPHWLRTGHGCYWINGKAGSGKSTLMKFITHHPETSAALKEWAGQHSLQTAAFYFWSTGTELQKSQEGLLRSLLHTILKASPELISICFRETIDETLSKFNEVTQGVCFSDTPKFPQLRKAFARILKHDSTRLKLCLFIDGLDEYDGDVQEICDLFKSVTKFSMLKIVLSSRPIPACVEAFHKCAGLRLQDLTRPDIELFVKDSLREHSRMRALQRSEPEDARSLVDEIVQKSSGVFLWVILVTKSLLNGLSNFDDIEDLRRRVDALPPQLHDLYKHMLSSMDPLYRSQASRLLQLVFQRIIPRYNRSLTTLQLSFDDEDPFKAFSKTWMPLTSIEELIRCEKMEGRLRSRCCGLVEVQGRHNKRSLDTSMAVLAKSTGLGARKILELQDSEVQFLHRTVVDFLRDPEIWSFVISLCEDKAFNVNVNLMASSIRVIKSLSRDTSLDVSVSPAWQAMRDCLFYASRAEETTGISQTRYLDELNRAMMYHWQGVLRWKASGNRNPDGNFHRDRYGNFLQSGSLPGFWYNVEGDWTCTVDYPGRSAKHRETLVSLAVSQDLVLYLEDVLIQNPKAIIGRLDFQILAQVIRCLAIDMYRSFDKQLAIVEVLFKHGANPNAEYSGGPSAWTVLLTYLQQVLEPIDRTKLKRWSKLIEVFVKAGANVNIPIQVGDSVFTPLAMLEKKWEPKAVVKRMNTSWWQYVVTGSLETEIVTNREHFFNVLTGLGAISQSWRGDASEATQSVAPSSRLIIQNSLEADSEVAPASSPIPVVTVTQHEQGQDTLNSGPTSPSLVNSQATAETSTASLPLLHSTPSPKPPLRDRSRMQPPTTEAEGQSLSRSKSTERFGNSLRGAFERLRRPHSFSNLG